MQIKPKSRIVFSFIFIFLAVLIIAIFVLTGNEGDYKYTDTGYYMKSLNNTVVLYKNDDIVKVYDGIVVDTLPIADRDMLEKGVHFENIADADIAAEDYDG